MGAPVGEFAVLTALSIALSPCYWFLVFDPVTSVVIQVAHNSFLSQPSERVIANLLTLDACEL